MNIIEAIKSGLRYRRIGEELWYESSEDYRDYVFPLWAILGDDWEIEEKSVKITAGSFFEAYTAALHEAGIKDTGSMDEVFNLTARMLGL